ncbi:ABC transporter permease [Leucobacter allii]|uniref:ABC transporter permease n=1 Tax=Leucobacter allii TaxID=2932247 RepID=A0ABY4FM79_9MICO|nr:ABC transporter permease [Leucobacter allii]UOQ57374.1 ABC transporter permease [Leucobacter allii]UOR01822.1 ABC transporter permease [Leucobacter allii]
MGTGRRARVLRGAIGILALFIVAEVVSRSGIVDAFYFPPTSVVLLRVLELLVTPSFLVEVLATLQAWAVGMVICSAVAIALGVLLGSSRGAYSASRAIIEFVRPIPSVALIPVAMLLLGKDIEMKVGLIVFSAAWPILFNTIYGMHDVDPIAKLTARSFGRGRLATLWSVSLPSAAPFIFTGVRISASVALIVAVSAEFFGGSSTGLGYWLIQVSSTGNRSDLVFAGAIIAGLLGLAINGVLALAERRFLSWQPALRGTGGEAR